MELECNNMTNSYFNHYKHEVSFPGEYWCLYTKQNGHTTDYYIYHYITGKKYDLFYGNGFHVTENDSLEQLKLISIKIFEKFPRMATTKTFDVEEFYSIKALVNSFI